MVIQHVAFNGHLFRFKWLSYCYTFSLSLFSFKLLLQNNWSICIYNVGLQYWNEHGEGRSLLGFRIKKGYASRWSAKSKPPKLVAKFALVDLSEQRADPEQTQCEPNENSGPD